jgi:hypothetical protein
MTTLDLDALEEQAKHASEAHDLATRNALLRTMSITYPELIFANHCREDVPALIAEVRRLHDLLNEATTIIELHDPNHRFLEQFEVQE